MKAKHLRNVPLYCKCGNPFNKISPKGVWYWCLVCDAHMFCCKTRPKAVTATKACGCLV